jgi:Ca-activated chloride channel homolog
MHLRNKAAVGITLCLVAVGVLTCVMAKVQAQEPASSHKVVPTPLPSDVDPGDPAIPVWMRPAPTAAAASTPAANKPTNGPPGQQTSGQQPGGQPPAGQTPGVNEVTKSGDKFVYRQQVDEVTLQATVIDQKRHLVTTLNVANFEVFEDGQAQKITSFRREDIPVSIGIVVDNSGSMRTKRSAVTKAVVNLVQASNTNDEVFIVNFNDEPYLDQDFTNKIPQMREALDRVDSRGGTALYDAVIASADHLAKGAKRDKRVLLVITDGDDNESRESLEQAVRTVQIDNGPTIYCIGILSAEDRKRTARRALEALSAQTGGVAFFPKDLQEVDEISQEVARDIRNQYTITYKPSNPRSNGGYRQVHVTAHAAGYKDQLVVRTRSGYYANEQKTASSGGSGH